MHRSIANYVVTSLVRGVVLLLMFMPLLLKAGEVVQHRDPRSGLLSWKAKHPGFSLRLVQMLPDYVRAVYSSRGFPEALIDKVLEYCVFGTILTNDSDTRLSYRIDGWRAITSDGEAHPIKAKSAWAEEWAAMGVPFRWTMLADEQTFEPGDWMQGFTTVRLSPGDYFDFVYSWRIRDDQHHGNIKGVRCAPITPPVP